MIIECTTFDEVEKKIQALEELDVEYTVKKEHVKRESVYSVIPPHFAPHWTIVVKELST